MSTFRIMPVPQLPAWCFQADLDSPGLNLQCRTEAEREAVMRALGAPEGMISGTALPPRCAILNDGPGREVLVHEQWEECPVFETVAAARAFAWRVCVE